MPDTPDRAAREAAARMLKLEAAAIALSAKRRLRLATEHPDTPSTADWKLSAERDLTEATQLKAVAAWLEGQDG